MNNKFYITTPIYYINAEPTIGSAYTTIIADVLAKWHKLKDEKVFFLTGTDENSIKTVKAAKEKGYNNIQEYADNMAKKWKNVWKVLNINYDGFIRTTEQRHKKVVQDFFVKLYKKGDIYKGKYEGLYCEGCEAFLTEKDLVENKCPLHKTTPKKLVEENYFFKLSKYQDQILKYIEEHKDFILPKHRKNEVISFIKQQGLKDISISRENMEFGIEIPIDKKHKAWTWFDALLNYISGSEGNWPAEVHLLAKDILRFHCVIWPGILMSAGYKLPKQLFIHGFLTINGQKMSKSLGNAIDPVYLANKYSTDALRYFLIREIRFGEDGDFSEAALKDRLNNELANDLGNLLTRTLSMVEKYFKGKIPEGKNELKFDINSIKEKMDGLNLTDALADIWKIVNETNRYINEKKPWESDKKEKILYTVLDNLRIISILLYPFIPETAEKITKQLGLKKIGSLKDCKPNLLGKGKINKGEMLFKKAQ